MSVLRAVSLISGLAWLVTFNEARAEESQPAMVDEGEIVAPFSVEKVLTGHRGAVGSVSLSSDGRTIASGSRDNTIRLWDLRTGKQLRELIGHRGAVHSVSFNSDNRVIASGSDDDTIRIWDVDTGEQIRVLKGHDNDVLSVSFSPDGHTIVSGSRDKTIRIWDFNTGEERRVLAGHTGSVQSVTFSPHGHTIASGSDDNTIRIWDADVGSELHVLKGHSDGILSVAFSPEEDVVASGSADDTIRIWDLLTGKELRSIDEHSGPVWSVSFSPDGRTIASGSEDKTIRAWDFNTGRELCALSGHGGAVSSVRFSSDGRTITSGSDDGTIRTWELNTGKQLRALAGHTAAVRSVSFSPDGRAIASGSDDSTIQIWDLITGKPRHALVGHSGAVRSVSFSPNGRTIASGSDDHTIRIWDVITRKQLRAITVHGDTVSSVSFGPDGSAIASGSEDSTVRIWDLRADKQLRALVGHGAAVRSVSFSPDGRTIASGSNDRTVRIWDSHTSEELRRLTGHGGAVRSVRFSPDGRTIASGSDDSTIRIWNPRTGKQLHALLGHSAAVRSVSFSPDGRTIASGSDDKTIRIWDLRTGKQLRVFSGIGGDVLSVSYSPDGRTIASGSSDKAARIWDLSTGTELRAFSERSAVLSTSFSPDGRAIASGSNDNTIRIWDLGTGKQLRALAGHSDAVRSVSFSADGLTIASGSDDNTIRVWDVSTGEHLHAFAGRSGTIFSVSFSPDGRTIGAGSDDKTVRIWDLITGELIRAFAGHRRAVYSVSFSPDEQMIASGSDDKTVRIWDLITGEELRVLVGHSDAVASVSFSPDGRWIASGSFDHTIRIWDLMSGKASRELTGHTGPVRSVRFSPDGRTIASSSDDHTIRIWHLGTGKQILALAGHSDAIGSVSLSLDGSTLASGSDDGRIGTWSLPDGIPQRWFFGLRSGGWFSVSNTGLLVRADDGKQIETRDSSFDGFRTLLPAPASQRTNLRVTSIPPVTIKDGSSTTVTIAVRNVGNGPAYGVRIEPSPEQRSGLIVQPAAYRSRIDPGQEASIPVFVSYLHRWASDAPGPSELACTAMVAVVSLNSNSIGIQIPVQVRAPKIVPETPVATVSDGLATLRWSFKNEGTVDPGATSISIELVDSSSGTRTPTSTTWLSGMAPGKVETIAVPIPDTLVGRPGLMAHATVLGSTWPSHEWNIEEPVTLRYSRTLFVAAISLLLAFAGGVGYYARILRHPLVVLINETPSMVRALPASDAIEVDRRLRWARAREGIIATLGIREARWLIWMRSSSEPARAIADVVSAELRELNARDLSFRSYRFSAPTLGVGASSETALVVVGHPSPQDLSDRLRAVAQTAGFYGRYLLLIDTTAEQNIRAKLSGHPLKIVVLDQKQLTEVILASQPGEALARIFAAQAELRDVSPYKTAGAVDNQLLFYGRADELARLNRTAGRNHLVIGPRQMGKSSLLHALRRSSPESTYYVQLPDADLDNAFSLAGLPPLDALIEQHAKSAPPTFLLDEIDRFVVADRARNYELCRKFRALAETGRGAFVLAGFWEAHRAAYLEHTSPLRNFADPLNLGPLEPAPARALATEPLERIGLRYENSDATTQELIERTGCRPNLIARACDAVLNLIPPLGERIITVDMLHSVLDVRSESGQAVTAAIQDVLRSYEDQTGGALDRAVLYAALKQPRTSMADLLETFARFGAQLSPNDLRESCERLVLMYALRQTAGLYSWPVPILREWVLFTARDNPDEAIELELATWKERAER